MARDEAFCGRRRTGGGAGCFRAALRCEMVRRDARRHCAAHNDMFVKKADGKIGTSTNRSGGIQGGRVPPMYGACSVQDAPWDVIACNVQHATCNMQLTAYNVAVAGSAFARRSRTARTLSSPSRLSRRRRSARRRSSPIRGRTDRYSENTYHPCGAACMDDPYSENTYHQCGAACMDKLEISR